MHNLWEKLASDNEADSSRTPHNREVVFEARGLPLLLKRGRNYLEEGYVGWGKEAQGNKFTSLCE